MTRVVVRQPNRLDVATAVNIVRITSTPRIDVVSVTQPRISVLHVHPIETVVVEPKPIRIRVSNTGRPGPPGNPGPPGQPGPPGRSFDFIQSTPSTVWTVAHNMGTRPAVSTTTLGGIVIDGEVQHLSENVLSVQFNIPIAGRAHLV